MKNVAAIDRTMPTFPGLGRAIAPAAKTVAWVSKPNAIPEFRFGEPDIPVIDAALANIRGSAASKSAPLVSFPATRRSVLRISGSGTAFEVAEDISRSKVREVPASGSLTGLIPSIVR